MSTYGQNTTIMSHKIVHRLYNYMFRPWVLAIFRLFTTCRSAIQYAVGFTRGGRETMRSYLTVLGGMAL